jgi:hypothetical protein
MAFLVCLFTPNKKRDGGSDYVKSSPNEKVRVNNLYSRLSNNKILSISILIIAVSLFFYFAINPILKERKLTKCLEGVDTQKAEVDAFNATIRVSENKEKSAIEVLRENVNGGWRTINVEVLKEECYRQSL